MLSISLTKWNRTRVAGSQVGHSTRKSTNMAQNSFLVSLSFFFQIWTMFSATKSIWIEDGRKVIFVAVAVNRFFCHFCFNLCIVGWIAIGQSFPHNRKTKKLVSNLFYSCLNSDLYQFQLCFSAIPAENLLYISFQPTVYQFPTYSISVSKRALYQFQLCSIPVAKPALYQFQSLLYTSCTTCSIPVSKPALYQLHNLLYPSWKPALYHCQACSMLASNLLCTSSRTAQCQFRTLPKHHCKMMLGIFLLKSLH